MIQFSLKCAGNHRFDSWFQSAEAFEKLQARGMVTCAVCGSDDVEKALMAPRVRASRACAQDPDTPTAPESGALGTPASPAEKAMTELRRRIEENSEYVGGNFAREARDMHDGITPERAIYGEARPEEARKLVEEGVPVAPLPFIPGRKSN
ncbi:hypothetical protein SAMN04487859_105180 [Roseovarius lutimaris]|uniref:DUF1178 family protein n=1 Tax=Roseovarius lutimaris TaxID=1005928 RepID=A0A1I5A9G1_9RHOB|nr:DUF1178 family protein [Roseovarius lutimaris]SFN59221.1 hypothetical protein SAMN04487859_105180 [Roseovarius lutimaris]